jgi:hypothetical protein
MNQAENAVSKFNGKRFNDTNLKLFVQIAKPRDGSERKGIFPT